ncbi:hypothetical protein NIES267_73170 (plasmid) [Calothrix parasitica NIES-267]|uniref:Uncharacterized protein n=1 Tax=Calothrix parasitica NIES-267 TaxID=1973488 RepID=A0A1Z4M2R8_9CYAN|nr:hypothetical protein NIES267_73170 [Calothrix parasitica NIES-267]
MKHIDKILPLSILVLNLILIINSIYGEFYIFVFNHLLNSGSTVLAINILSILILIVPVLLSFIKKIKFQKIYTVFTIPILLLTLIFSVKALNNYLVSPARKCNGKQYHFVIINPILPEPGHFNPLNVPKTDVTTLENGVLLSKVNTDSEIEDMKKCF